MFRLSRMLRITTWRFVLPAVSRARDGITTVASNWKAWRSFIKMILSRPCNKCSGEGVIYWAVDGWHSEQCTKCNGTGVRVMVNFFWIYESYQTLKTSRLVHSSSCAITATSPSRTFIKVLFDGLMTLVISWLHIREGVTLPLRKLSVTFHQLILVSWPSVWLPISGLKPVKIG